MRLKFCGSAVTAPVDMHVSRQARSHAHSYPAAPGHKSFTSFSVSKHLWPSRCMERKAGPAVKGKQALASTVILGGQHVPCHNCCALLAACAGFAAGTFAVVIWASL